jgi:ligand-binding sensor domain-containing protein
MEGFLWFGTETGLSRFDGTHFTNFTRKDGLPDNEIINLFADSKGRIWIAPFRSAVCYYYRGKIFTNETDTILNKINPGSYIASICEDKEGNVLLMEKKRLHLVRNDGEVIKWESFNGNRETDFIQIGRHPEMGFWVKQGDTLFQWTNGRINSRKFFNEFSRSPSLIAYSGNYIAYSSDTYFADVDHVNTGKIFRTRYRMSKNRFSILRDSLFVWCSRQGALVVNLKNPADSVVYLKDVAISAVLIDNEQNLWFSTQGQGVYKLNSRAIRNVYLKEGDNAVGVTAISSFNGKILIGGDNEVLYATDINLLPITFSRFQNEYNQARAPIISIETSVPGLIFYGTGQRLFRLRADFGKADDIYPINVKKVFAKNNRELVVGTGSNIVIVDPHSLKIVDTIWQGRTTCVFEEEDTLYVGTIDGLYRRLPGGQLEFLGEKHPVFLNRFTHITAHKSGTLWMSTYGDGIVGYRGGKVVAHLTTKGGLTSNICKALFLHGDNLWIGTDKGLNKVYVGDTNLTITKYTVADGLASDNINAVFQQDSIVFVGSSAGVTYFNESYLVSRSICNLRLTGIRVNDEIFTYDSSGFVLARDNNNIRFDFVGISYRSVGDIQYRFRLLGLDSTWRTTRETFLSYPTLPSGQYELQLMAINKFGVQSELKQVRFTVAPLVWERTWFRLLMGGLSLCLITLLIWYLTQRVRKREEEKTRINARIAELEQLALKSQMNPHFIFNSLNSIQQYVMDKDVSGANKFISGFSRLIRQTLDFSSKPLVHLQDEIGYLQTYLELEKNRLEEKFNYEVEVSEELRNEDYYIPPMVLQPFLENSLRHGIRYRKDNEGRVKIRVYKGYQQIVCVIEDNGVGREQAARNKRANPIEYQSKGMTLTANRIDLINKDRQKKIKVQIEDLFHADGSAAGTRVSVIFPDNLQY